MIEVSHLTRRFGSLTAVDDASFRLEPGEVVGFLGPNGAGKTTTLRILAGYLPATSGKATVAGHDVGSPLVVAVPQVLAVEDHHVLTSRRRRSRRPRKNGPPTRERTMPGRSVDLRAGVTTIVSSSPRTSEPT